VFKKSERYVKSFRNNFELKKNGEAVRGARRAHQFVTPLPQTKRRSESDAFGETFWKRATWRQKVRVPHVL